LMPEDSYPFSVRARQVRVYGGDTKVFEYATSDDANRDGGMVSSDGGTIGRTAFSWIDAPHFYRSGRVLALYVGRDPAVMQPLEAILGTPFAQR
jgi:hypothetical protein